MVTRYLAQMEQWAGARLLHRTTRKLSLTDAGERTLERCRQMLALAGRSTWWRKGRAMSCAACCASPVRSRSGKRRWWGRRSVSEASPAGGGRSADEQPGGEPGGRAHRSGAAYHQRAGSQPDRPPAVHLRIGGVRCAGISGGARHPASTAGSGVAQLPDLLLFRQKPVALRCSGREIGGSGQRQPECQRVGGADGRHGAGAGISMQPYYSAAPLLASGELVELLPDYRPQSMGIYGIYTSRRQMPATLRTMLDFWWSGSPPIRSGRPRCADASAIFPRRFQRLTAAASRAAKAAAC